MYMRVFLLHISVIFHVFSNNGCLIFYYLDGYILILYKFLALLSIYESWISLESIYIFKKKLLTVEEIKGGFKILNLRSEF